MNYTLKQIAEILNYKENNININDKITGIAIDSRKIKQGDLFIPFFGKNVDGHKYIKTALENGAVASLSMNKNISTKNTIYVNDTLESLQKIAKDYLNKIKPKVIAITGSNGKTTTKDITFELVKDKYKAFKTQGNYNNELGVPLTILSAPEETEILILEMGADGFGQLEKLSELANPDFTIITNIGESHIEYFKNREGIAKEKFEINKHLKKEGTFIYNGDEVLLKNLVNNQEINSISCGEKENNDVIIKNFKNINKSCNFLLSTISDEIYTNLKGKHNALNMAYAVTIAKKLNISNDIILEKLKNLTSITKMRLENLEYGANSLIINDSYNASPTSMIAAINVLEDISEYKYKTLVLGDMYELGTKEIEFHEKVGEYINNNSKTINKIISIGNLAKNITNKIIKINTLHFDSKKDLIEYFKNNENDKEVILFKASRSMKLEEIIEELID